MKFLSITRLATALLLVAVLGVSTTFAQDAPPLGDEFIFFVNGANTIVPSFDGQIVNDPFDPANKVMQFTYGDWSFKAFRFDAGTGVDMTDNIADGDVIHLRLLVDPANQGKPNVRLAFWDKTDGSGADDGTADMEFRANWLIPEEMRTGEWFEIEIPFPPLTWQELEDARAAGTLDPLADPWTYGGAWSSGGFGVALDGQGPNSGERPELFREFEWTNVQAFGAFFDNADGGGPIWIDDLYIGPSGLDLSAANNPAAAMSGVSFDAGGPVNALSWTHNPDFGGYNIYFSDNPITDIGADGVQMLTSVLASEAADDGTITISHRFEAPHATLSPFDVNYAVTSLSQFGVENPDVSASAVTVSNPNLPIQPSIVQLTEEEGNILFDNLSAGVVSGEGFPADMQPFILDSSHSSLGENLPFPDSDDDNSGTFWFGYTDLNELWMYAEVKDDVVTLGAEGVAPGDAWMYDSIELGWGNYDVSDAGGSVVGGSPHQDMERGAQADYQFRSSAFADGNTYAWVGNSLNDVVPGGGVIFDVLTDGDGNEIGWKSLTLWPLDAIQAVDQGDLVLDPPGPDEMRLMPFTVTLNDADGGTREHQITWSVKNNVTNQWWNTPAQWPTVAMHGRNLFVPTDVETVDPSVPDAYTLEQNYPNPFNPATTIRFALTQPETVKLTVFDHLGRRIATLVNNEALPIGTHQVSFDASKLASGAYIYRLEAGSFSQTRQMMLLK